MQAILRSGWGEAVPFIILSHRLDVGEVAAALGAVAGVRKPITYAFAMPR